MTVLAQGDAVGILNSWDRAAASTVCALAACLLVGEAGVTPSTVMLKYDQGVA